MHYLLVADIFGRTKALENIAAELTTITTTSVTTVDIIDPYQAQMLDFNNEADAYAYFTTEVGLAAYTEQLLQRLLMQTTPVTLIGFSVGAAAVWQLSSHKQLTKVVAATCFYGSQIRYHLDIQPAFPLQLIFPAQEPHFSVSELIRQLAGRANVSIQQVKYLHGFMNRHSDNYDAASCRSFIKELSNE
ncbi:dienelactone hydrolase family protein [Rheinheimera salexigens]|uniref:Dienelactone hydrolase domain-containing protein n=1 Tax=Rheinheimera salexigens TaxID=1628148 RepID=A0A1E7Q2Y2_9GAMM|nr:dienelactone hydrolase family protein [Rheinheimera salexigens]OEY68532.1 hypothetical protein BI198_02315 [Rheinheimera salexigens]